MPSGLLGLTNVRPLRGLRERKVLSGSGVWGAASQSMVGGGNWNGDLQSNTHAQGQTTVKTTVNHKNHFEKLTDLKIQLGQGIYMCVCITSGGNWNRDLQCNTHAQGQTTVKTITEPILKS